MAANVVIIGGTKFIGPHVVRQLVAHGASVTVFHRGTTETDLPSRVRHVHSPAASLPLLSFPPELLVPEPDIVIHMICMGERDAQAAVSTFRRRAQRL